MKPPKEVTFQGRVKRITFANPDNGYTVAKVEGSGSLGLTTLVGRMPGLTEGQEVEVKGKESVHPKFGPQIEVEECKIKQPSDAEGVERYLASGLIKGVGPVLAKAMVETLGPLAVDIILESPKRLAEVPGVGPKRAQAIAEAVAAHGALREVMVFLQGHGIAAGTALRIFRRYGAGALDVVQTRPHRLAADIRGIGFTTADAIAAKLGIAHDHPERLQAGLLWILGQARDEGHVYLPYEELIERTAEQLKVDRELLGPAFARLHEMQEIVAENLPGGGRAVYLKGLQVMEDLAARELARIAGQEGLLSPRRAAKAVAWASGQLSVQPSPRQAKALEGLLTAGLGVLTGGPGTGKTTLVKAVIKVARRMGLYVALAAPTGRAAKRLSQASNMEASTLHRLLEYSPKENRFLRGPERPLEHGLIVVDESSMIDIWLGAHLASAVGPTSRLLLVGDADQLPPVGPGLFFRQIMDSGAAHVARLTEIFRQDESGLIVANAHRILHGKMPRLPSREGEGDFFFIEQKEPARAAEIIRELVASRLPARFGLDPHQDIQVLAPMHKGNLGCAHLNSLLRAALNPAAGGRPGLAVGDRVMQVRNNYDLEVFNGDLGLVKSEDDEGLNVAMDRGLVSYAPADLEDLTLAYAITVHKSQGSEYPCVVVALANEHYILLNRPLLYTAVTRGKGLVVIVGQRSALKRAVEHAQPIRRYAALDGKIRQCLAG
ncbi:MAG: ATP-dependent RecD-like DNA helicase [Desulfarculaceae bacterium]|nr:ATP-dependent RecD-like DNA helicase [Desulfarculaceae bacterium]MCF8073485.1 ATP-dependent RecD-like DNA helicase [Desulfarculaceae bacterium]MCF8100368.1 ATP-dependent RecD-like DNA helicase [Desulfarculaceae bacterium]MCF8115896.1 ATP-dependent RecD-like DNA helicase [Desulfarculaceae bacterium]